MLVSETFVLALR